MQFLDMIEDFCDSDPMVFLAIAAIIIAVLIAGLLLAMFWPLDPVRVTDDPMHHPFGDVPEQPRFFGGASRTAPENQLPGFSAAQLRAIARLPVSPEARIAPSPLVGEGWGEGVRGPGAPGLTVKTSAGALRVETDGGRPIMIPSWLAAIGDFFARAGERLSQAVSERRKTTLSNRRLRGGRHG